MSKRFWTVTEVVELFHVDEHFIAALEEEEIVCATCRDDRPTKLFSPGELEKLRIAKVLMDDMGINLAGVEVILRMRQDMLDMRRQFDAILEDLAEQFREKMAEQSDG